MALNDLLRKIQNSSISYRIIERKHDCYSVAIIVVVISGFCLRLYRLGFESLFMDEAISFSRTNWELIELTHSLEYLIHSLWDGILHFWVIYFGNSEISLRFPSVLFGSLSILLIYPLGKQIFGKFGGLVGSVILATSPAAIGFSQEARGYTLSQALILASMICFVFLLYKPSKVAWIGYSLFSFMAMWAHIFSLFTILVQWLFLIWLLIRREITWKRAVSIFLAPSLLILPITIIVIFPMVNAYLNQTYITWIPNVDYKSIIYLLIRYGGGRLRTLIYLSLFIIAIIPRRIIDSIPYSVSRLFEPNSEEEFFTIKYTDLTVLILGWLTLPILITFLKSLVGQSWFYWKYMSSSMLALFLGAAGGIVRFRSHLIKAIMILIVLILNLYALSKYYGHYYDSEQWREAVQIVKNNYVKDDVIILHSPSILIPFSYYAEKNNLYANVSKEKIITIDLENISSFKNFISSDRIWLIYSHETIPEQEILEKISMSDYKLIEKKLLVGINLYLFSHQ